MNTFDLPIIIEKDNEYVLAVREKTKEYLKKIEDLKTKPHLQSFIQNINTTINETKKIQTNIIKIFNFLFNGKMQTAINTLKNLVDRYSSKLITPILDSYAFRGDDYYYNPDDELKELYLYKGRIGEAYQSYKREDMFHIPLDKRCITRTERYSMPGVPCIYLAQNSYVVWKEMQMPSFDKLSISAYKITNPHLKIIDLTYSFQTVYDIFEDQQLFLQHYDRRAAKKVLEAMSIFPLIVAVSVKCREKNRHFKSEYAIPQLLMCCLKGNLIGIAYHSNEIPTDNNMFATNIAIPIINYKRNQKYGEIKNDIELTDPMNFDYFIKTIFSNRAVLGDQNSFARGIGAGHVFSGLSPILSFNRLINGMKKTPSYDKDMLYVDTPFYSFDDYILYMKAFQLVR